MHDCKWLLHSCVVLGPISFFFVDKVLKLNWQDDTIYEYKDL